MPPQYVWYVRLRLWVGRHGVEENAEVRQHGSLARCTGDGSKPVIVVEKRSNWRPPTPVARPFMVLTRTAANANPGPDYTVLARYDELEVAIAAAKMWMGAQ
jgi:hypothetical protein